MVTNQTSENGVEYRDIPGFPNYRAGSDGTIWTRYRRGRRKPFGWKLRKPTINKRLGYLMLWMIHSDGNRRQCYVHHLILFAFVGPKPDGMECLHGDDNRTNNRISNLEWGTRMKNVHQMIDRGRSHHHKLGRTVKKRGLS